MVRNQVIRSTDQKLTVSVVVPAYNAAATLPACLRALRQQTHMPDEIIVVDDGSTDTTPDIAKGHGVGLLSTRGKSGPAIARNLGALSARSDIVAFTDADCEPAPDWLEELIRPFNAIDGQRSSVVGVKGAYLTRQHALVARFVQQEYAHKYQRMARLKQIDFIDTYSAAYRSDIFRDNGGFETAFPVPSVEDQEFSFRLARKGYRMVFAPLARVYHQHDASMAEYITRKFGIGYWKAFMLRWLPEKAFSDTHTPASQRWQIACLGATLLFCVCGFVWPVAWTLAMVCLVIGFATSIPLLMQIARNDPAVVFIAPCVVLIRAMALAGGLIIGVIVPPRKQHSHKGELSLPERVVKRCIDVTVALTGAILAMPAIALAAVAIKLDSPGPVFYRQERAGEFGKPFYMYKLRSMIIGADRTDSGVDVPKPVFDPRVTRVGRILRRWSLDELPQFWNVLRGEMSIVGPRPERLDIVATYNDRQRKRLQMKPGITGPMQISGRGNLDLDTRVTLELGYMEHYSLWQDISILLHTIRAVITGIGAY